MQDVNPVEPEMPCHGMMWHELRQLRLFFSHTSLIQSSAVLVHTTAWHHVPHVRPAACEPLMLLMRASLLPTCGRKLPLS